MFSSKLIRRLILLVLMLVESGCVNQLGGNDTVATETPPAAENIEGQGATPGAVSTVQKPDPMAGVVIPLALLKSYDQINGLINNHQIDQAIERLTPLLKSYPQESGPSYRLAQLYLQQKQYDEALQAIDKSIDVKADNYFAYNLKGIILREQGQFAAAKTAYSQAITLYPSYSNAHLNLAILADIYLYDLPLAENEYQIYLSLLNQEDKTVEGWLTDLKRRIGNVAQSGE